MAQILSTGKIVDTGVAQESPTHAIMESPAHQRGAYPFIRSASMGYTLYFGGLAIYARVFESDSASMINICSDTTYVGIVTWSGSANGGTVYYDLGTDDDRGYDMTAPVNNPAALTFTGAATIWSNSLSAGTPFYKSSLMAGMQYSGGAAYPDDEPDGQPFTSWCCANDATAVWTDQTWYDAGTWTFTVNMDEGTALLCNNGILPGIGPPNEFSATDAFGMQGSFTATLNFGVNPETGEPLYTVTGNITDGWSGTGVSGNALLYGDTVGDRVWQATVTLTFATRWQFSGTFGPIDFTQPSALNSEIYGDNPAPTSGTFYCAGGQVSISGEN